MDAEAEVDEVSPKKSKKERKKEKKNKKAKRDEEGLPTDLVEAVKSTGDADKVQAVDRLVDEYYALDYEDQVGDLRTRFKYAKVPASSFNLTPEEILLATDAELNAFMSLKKLAPYRQDSAAWQAKQQQKQRKALKELRDALKTRKWGEEVDEEQAQKALDKRREKKRRYRENAEKRAAETAGEDGGAATAAAAAGGARGEDGEPPKKKKRAGKSERKRLQKEREQAGEGAQRELGGGCARQVGTGDALPCLVVALWAVCAVLRGESRRRARPESSRVVEERRASPPRATLLSLSSSHKAPDSSLQLIKNRCISSNSTYHRLLRPLSNSRLPLSSPPPLPPTRLPSPPRPASMTSTLPPLAQATSGSLGAVVSNALIYPLDTVTTRLQASRKRTSKGGYSSIPAAISTIFRTEGLAAFYSGLGPDSLSTLLSQFLYFFVYSALRDRFQARKASRAPPTAVGQGKAKGAKPPVLSAVEELAIGCLAGVVAKGAVSPLSMITVRAQTSSEPRQEVVGGKEGDKRTVEDSDSDDDEGGYGRAPSALALAKEIYEEQGIAGFWSGFQSTIILVRRRRASVVLDSFASGPCREDLPNLRGLPPCRRSTRQSPSTRLRRSSAPSSPPSTASTRPRRRPSSLAPSRAPSRRPSRIRSSSPRRASSSRVRRGAPCTGRSWTCSAGRSRSKASRGCTRAASRSSSRGSCPRASSSS